MNCPPTPRQLEQWARDLKRVVTLQVPCGIKPADPASALILFNTVVTQMRGIST